MALIKVSLNGNEVEVELRWPEGWQLDVTPRLRKLENSVGMLRTTLHPDPEDRRLVSRRTFEVSRREISVERYADLFSLYREVLANDTEDVILVRE